MTTPQRRITDDVPSATEAVSFWALSAIGMCAFTIVAVIAARVLAPADLGLVATIVGLAVPVITGMLAKAQLGHAMASDGRIQQLIEASGEQKRLEGQLQGQAEAVATIAALPEVTIAKVVEVPPSVSGSDQDVIR